jgi:hypothetical protein
VTKNSLPPEDQPGQGLIPVADPAAALAAEVAQNHPNSAWEVARAFYLDLTDDAGAQLDDLKEMVTPESLDTWGDFSDARELLNGTGMTTRTEIPAPGVAHVKFVTDPGELLVSDGPTMIMARAIATLQFRPETGRWMVHHLGDYCLPEDLPELPSDS